MDIITQICFGTHCLILSYSYIVSYIPILLLYCIIRIYFHNATAHGCTSLCNFCFTPLNPSSTSSKHPYLGNIIRLNILPASQRRLLSVFLRPFSNTTNEDCTAACQWVCLGFSPRDSMPLLSRGPEDTFPNILYHSIFARSETSFAYFPRLQIIRTRLISSSRPCFSRSIYIHLSQPNINCFSLRNVWRGVMVTQLSGICIPY